MNALIVLGIIIALSLLWVWDTMEREHDERFEKDKRPPLPDSSWGVLKLLYFGFIVWWFFPIIMIFEWILNKRSAREHQEWLERQEKSEDRS